VPGIARTGPGAAVGAGQQLARVLCNLSAGGVISRGSQFVPIETMPKQSIQKLTRDQVRQGLDQIPVDILLSAGPGKRPELTSKQREFARNLALGKSKAQSYRESYNTKASPKTQGDNACRLSRDTRIKTEVEAYKLALEAEKHRTPAQLKALLVQQLVQHSLDQDFPPAQRVQCLRLLGQLFEVGAFVEHKTITTINKSGDIRARLLATLANVTDITPIDSDQAAAALLEEIQRAPGTDDTAAPGPGDQPPAMDTPTAPGAPPAAARAGACATHTIPHVGSSSENILVGGTKNSDVVPDFDS